MIDVERPPPGGRRGDRTESLRYVHLDIKPANIVSFDMPDKKDVSLKAMLHFTPGFQGSDSASA